MAWLFSERNANNMAALTDGNRAARAASKWNKRGNGVASMCAGVACNRPPWQQPSRKQWNRNAHM